MKDLMSLVAICTVDLDSLGIKYGKVSNWTVNTPVQKVVWVNAERLLVICLI